MTLDDFIDNKLLKLEKFKEFIERSKRTYPELYHTHMDENNWDILLNLFVIDHTI